MLTPNARRPRQAAAGPGRAGLAAMLVTACNSSSSSAAPRPRAGRAPRPRRPAGPSAGPARRASRPRAREPAGLTKRDRLATGTSTFLAPAQDINGTALYRPACNSGCPLSGDSTAILDNMKWRTWSATEAVGTGIYKLDDCNPSCAAGRVYSVATVVTLSDPVKVCSPSGTRWFWSRASFTFPDGLPKALQGGSAPENPWIFATVVSAAQQSCAG